MHRVPHHCPVCGEKLTVTRVACAHCGTSIEGQFEGCRFCSLSPEEEKFLLIFLRNRGSIKDVEREMGISYPTVRAMLDRLIAAVHADEPDASAPADKDPIKPDETAPDQARRGTNAKARKAILQKLSRHEITAAEAAAALEDL